MSDPADDTAQAINESSSDSIPTLPDQETVHITLIKGFDNVHLDAEVRELNGEDEEYFASVSKRPDISYADYLTEVLKRGVVSIGGSAPGDTGDLIVGDRDMLFLGITKATYGPSKDVKARCPHCDESNDIVIELDNDFPVKYPTFDITQPISVETKKGVFKYRLPTGSDTAAAASAKDAAAANTIILSRCAIFDEGKEPTDRLDWARKLNASVRHKSADALIAIDLGPKLTEVNTQCAHCDQEMIIGLDWVSLLLG